MDDPNWKETLIDTWRALIELKQEGKVKAIGVSNFLPHHLQVLLDNFNEIPVVDQLELHLGYFQEYAVRFLQEKIFKYKHGVLLEEELKLSLIIRLF